MWSEEDLANDLVKIKEKKFNEILAFEKKPGTDDIHMIWRHQLVFMLTAFEQNDFQKQKDFFASLGVEIDKVKEPKNN